MTICEECGDMMGDTPSCTHRYIQYGDEYFERNTTYFDKNDKCHDCGISNKEGNVHHMGCDMERCPRCEGQLIGCGCAYLNCDDSCGDWEADGCDKDHAGSPSSNPPNGKITIYTEERKKRIQADRAKEILSWMNSG